jgi:hypothetical protein
LLGVRQVPETPPGPLPRHWKAVLVTAAVVAILGLSGGFYYRNFIYVDTHVVVRFERQGGRVEDDADLTTYLGGSETPSATLATAAFCVNGGYWRKDETLNLVAVVGSVDRLVRAAELVADGSYPSALVTAIEGPALRSLSAPVVGVDEVADSVVEDFGRDVVRRYLADVAVVPGAAARERFLVFAASSTLWEQYVYLVDLDDLNRDAIDAFVDGPFSISGDAEDVIIGGTGARIRVTDDMCGSLT